jgi:hypothetical protein
MEDRVELIDIDGAGHKIAGAIIAFARKPTQ